MGFTTMRLTAAAFLFVTLLASILALCSAGPYNAIFNFGDSLVDAGNLIYNGTPPNLATARFPYGITYFGKPTGRCSDGRLVVDFIAQELGLPLLPPSKSLNASFATGANFAVTGATALETEFFEERELGHFVWNSGALHTQIQWLMDLRPSICGSPEDCREFFGKSLFIVGEFGGNDYNAPLFGGKKIMEAYDFMPHVMKSISEGIEKLIAEGAKDLLVPGVMPIGCFPVYLSIHHNLNETEYGARSGCIRKFNTFAWVHNSMLRRTVALLQQKYPEVRVTYADYYTPVIQFVLEPEKFGFHRQLPRACCGAPGHGVYNFNMTMKCGEEGATSCDDPTTHWSWDGIHLTEAAYGHIARGWLNGPFADPPIRKSTSA